MRIAYLDCFAGISGDMFLGALLDAGLAPQVLHDAIASLNLGASLKIAKTDRSGISSTRVLVFDGTQAAESAQSESHDAHPHNHEHDHTHAHTHDHTHSHDHVEPHTHEKKPEAKAHHHGRHLSSIRKIIQSSTLADEVKQTAIHAFELLGASEAKIHNVDIEKIHFHEVGAIDAIVDIVAASAGIRALAIDQWFSSPLNVGGGSIDCAHGHFPVPAPATADLLRGLPTYSADPQMELVTPTGAAILRALSPTFSQPPVMRIHRIGYGAGGRNPNGFPNVLRLNIGETAQTTVTDTATNTVTVLETALDDLNPQIIAHVAEQALQQGALDVMLTPVVMKKGRPGTLLTVLCDPEKSSGMERLLLRETSTLGIRIHQQQRSCLDRSYYIVPTPYGEIRIKVGSLGQEVLNANPEFEDCRAAAAAHNVPVKQVVQSAIAAYHSSRSK